MNTEHKISLYLTLYVSLFFIVLSGVGLFLFSHVSSLSEFQINLTNLFIPHSNILYGVVLFGALLIGIFSISYLIIHKGFIQIDQNNKKLSDYNHYLAHELKTPLSIVTSNLDCLKYEYNTSFVTRSQSEIKNMVTIIDGLLYFSESMHVSDKKDINLEKFIHQFITSLNLQETQKISIVNKQFNASVYTDEMLFGRLIKNILENACKYSVDGSLQVEIIENGIIFRNPIPETLSSSELESISEKFYSDAGNNVGHGLGLSLIKEITRILGFNYKVSSCENLFIIKITF